MIKDWLEKHWVAGAIFMGAVQMLLLPVVVVGNDRSVLLIYLASGILIHQVEEHTGDRFRSYVNSKVFGGVEALPRCRRNRLPLAGGGYRDPIRNEAAGPGSFIELLPVTLPSPSSARIDSDALAKLPT